MAERVLIADKDTAMRELLHKAMRGGDLEDRAVDSGSEVRRLLSGGGFSLLLMDTVLTDMDGFELIRELRGQGLTIPILIVSERSEDCDILYGLSIGADDYITKPFRPHILAAKVKAMIRRSGRSFQENQLTCGGFAYNTMTMRFYQNGCELNLSAKERAMLLLFLKHPQQVFTKDMIYEQVWGNTVAVDDNTIMVYINRLRSKIEHNARTPKHIITVRGLGYRFVP